MNYYKRTSILISLSNEIDALDELSSNRYYIQQAFQLTGDLQFKKLIGGICNAPVYIYQIEQGEEIPVGVFKQELHSETLANARFAAIDEMNEKGFKHHPRIIKNKEGHYLTKIGSQYYSVIEYIQSDPDSPEKLLSLSDMLELTSMFHCYAKQLGHRPDVASSRLALHLSRQKIIYDSFWGNNYADFFNSVSWQKILPFYQFFATDSSKQLFDALPKQFIIGDNHQANIIFKGDFPYFIDLDPRRYDVRLHDFTSIIRDGSLEIFNEYMQLSISGQFFDLLDKIYGKLNSLLSRIEKDNFYLMMAFSYCEFFSWVLNKIKFTHINDEHETADHLYSLFLLRVNQLISMMDLNFIKETEMFQLESTAIVS